MTQRCTGQCCREMTIRAVDAVGGLEPFRNAAHGRIPEYDSDEHRYIGDMLIDLNRKVDVCPMSLEPSDTPMSLYGCKHFDNEKGNCTTYEARPAMCRTYPMDTNHGCRLPGCTFVGPPEPNAITFSTRIGKDGAVTHSPALPVPRPKRVKRPLERDGYSVGLPGPMKS